MRGLIDFLSVIILRKKTFLSQKVEGRKGNGWGDRFEARGDRSYKIGRFQRKLTPRICATDCVNAIALLEYVGIYKSEFMEEIDIERSHYL